MLEAVHLRHVRDRQGLATLGRPRSLCNWLFQARNPIRPDFEGVELASSLLACPAAARQWSSRARCRVRQDSPQVRLITFSLLSTLNSSLGP